MQHGAVVASPKSFGSELSRITNQSGTPTIMLPPPKPLGPPHAQRPRCKHDAVVATPKFFGSGLSSVDHDRIRYPHHIKFVCYKPVGPGCSTGYPSEPIGVVAEEGFSATVPRVNERSCGYRHP